MAATYLIVAAGVPLPMAGSASKNAERFPCEACPCGCHSADVCWSNCCCHTLAERLAWAKANGVRPPEFALADARSENLDTSAWDGERKTVRAVVVAKLRGGKPCCSAKKPAATSNCCSRADSSMPACCAKRNTHDHDAADRTIVGWRTLACQGQSLHWLAAVPTLILVDLDLADQLPLVAWRAPLSSEIAAGRADVPTPPPPELS